MTRPHLAEALNAFDLGGKRDLLELLRKHWPSIHPIGEGAGLDTPADDILRHTIRFNDWDNAEVLEQVGFLTCSQAKLFSFPTDLFHPVRHDREDQERMAFVLDPILQRDGYCFVPSRRVRLSRVHGPENVHGRPCGRVDLVSADLL